MAKFLVTGGTGFIGTQLVSHLVSAGHEAVVLTRSPGKHAGKIGDSVRYIAGFDEVDNAEFFMAVINLAGEGIGDKRWSDKRKKQLLESRVALTDELVKCLARLQVRPEVMISGSAIGWYGASDATPLDESAGFNNEFTHELCAAWEQSASAVEALGIRLCIIRLAVVLGKDGGVLKKLLPPFYVGLGGRIGSGEQYMSWIHREDVIKAIQFLVSSPGMSGVYNLAAPDAVTNRVFTRGIGMALSRPTFFPLPAFVVKTVFGEMGDRLLLQGQNVVPRRLQEAGFTFDYQRLEDALADILVK